MFILDVCTAGAVAVWAEADFIAHVLVDQDYRNSAALLLFLGIGYLLFVVQQVFGHHLLSHLRTGAVLLGQLTPRLEPITVTRDVSTDGPPDGTAIVRRRECRRFRALPKGTIQ